MKAKQNHLPKAVDEAISMSATNSRCLCAEPITGTIIASAAPSFILPALAQQALPPGARWLEHLNRHWACNLNLNAD
jgi:hypothetical protein